MYNEAAKRSNSRKSETLLKRSLWNITHTLHVGSLLTTGEREFRYSWSFRFRSTHQAYVTSYIITSGCYDIHVAKYNRIVA